MDTVLPIALIKEHYLHPRNQRLLAVVTYTGSAENPYCGDSISVELHIADQIIKEISFRAQGCSLCVASASLWSEKVIGMSMDKMLALPEAVMLEPFNVDIQHHRAKCLLLVRDALQAVKPISML